MANRRKSKTSAHIALWLFERRTVIAGSRTIGLRGNVLNLRTYPSMMLVAFCCVVIPSKAQDVGPPLTRTQSPERISSTMVEGTITDTTGAAVVGVRVSITAAAGGHRYEAMSDSHGHYQIASPVAGTYSIKAEQSGFGPKTSQVTVVAGEAAHADIQFGIASLSQDVVVTGSGNVEFGAKSGIPIEQVPQSIQVLDQEDFKNMDVHSIGDVLKAVPSATPGAPRTSTYQYFSQRIRGFVPVQIVNGVYPRYYANIDPSATSNIERIEVLKGPSAVLYGQTGVGGIISIVTKQPQHDFAGSVSVIGGQYDRFAGSFDVTGPVRDLRGVYFRATGEIERSGTYIRYYPINRDNGAFSLNWEASSRVAAHFVSQWQERDTLRNPGLPALGTVISNGIARRRLDDQV
jgi:outer membrane receptor protein involved in Fe transport